MIGIVIVAIAAVVVYGLALYLRAAASGRGAQFRHSFMRAWRSQ